MSLVPLRFKHLQSLNLDVFGDKPKQYWDCLQELSQLKQLKVRVMGDSSGALLDSMVEWKDVGIRLEEFSLQGSIGLTLLGELFCAPGQN